ncbi:MULTISPECIES: DUF429 domain-containing protein [Micromonospora]|uniref:DUF429 domain-containing protein n=1 Tax=Micromonospora TaxID=1873 RepID=UPI0003EEA485|nr:MULTISPECIES: DUF429 domain-containing protein [unclassified Micromonospora]EWM62973.1 hypothetical protein MCBG_00106 [Micromonospora sp. M42]
MRTLGVDLAAANERTAMAAIEWLPDRAVVRDLLLGINDAQIVEASRHADKTGIDCPFGWPAPFVAFVVAHQAGHVTTVADVEGGAWRRELAYRLTDEVVRDKTGIVPLSVAADRIGHAAFRCAGLLSMLAADGQDVDRCGDGRAVEVYPAAALNRWGLTHRGYKGRRRKVQPGDIVTALSNAAPWLEFGAFEALARRSHDAFDAVIASLAARAAATGRVNGPNDEQRPLARSEGWIALPTSPLRVLIETADPTTPNGSLPTSSRG